MITILTLLAQITVLINRLVPLMIGFGVLFFLYGLAKYMLQTDSTEGRATARQVMLWGVIMIFVMVSIWGLVNLIIWTAGFQVTNNLVPMAPFLPVVN